MGIDEKRVLAIMPDEMKVHYITCLSSILSKCNEVHTVEEVEDFIEESIEKLSNSLPDEDSDILGLCMEVANLLGDIYGEQLD